MGGDRAQGLRAPGGPRIPGVRGSVWSNKMRPDGTGALLGWGGRFRDKPSPLRSPALPRGPSTVTVESHTGDSASLVTTARGVPALDTMSTREGESLMTEAAEREAIVMRWGL